MFDCSKDVRAYHDQEVSLPKSEQDAMRDRRNANRTRLRNGLAEAGKPAPLEFVKQGSYAMKTMTCDPGQRLRHRRRRLLPEGGSGRRPRRRDDLAAGAADGARRGR